jgi:hypothetical protein
MQIVKAQRRLLTFIHARRAGRPRRSLQDWIALTIARGLTLAVIAGLVYVTYIVEMTSYKDFLRCNPKSSITRIEWVLGFRPVEDCRRF